jgi:nucleotide-binding universal stress UspA family protein
MKIVIAVDSSPGSKNALQHVAARVWPPGSAACLLSVIDIGKLGGLVDTGPLLNGMTEAAEQLVKSEAELLAGSGLETTTAVTVGHPSSSIAEYAKQWQADFIYLGSHGHRGLTRFLLGSVSKSVVQGAACSVGIIRTGVAADPAAGTRPGLRVLLATDGSDCSLAAARSIARRPWLTGSKFRIISIADVIEASIELWYTDVGLLEELQRLSREHAQRAIDAAEPVLTTAGLTTVKQAFVGLPRAAILDDAERWQADLIVVGSHGKRGIDRLLLGSVSESIAVHAPCSVEVIR